METLSFRIVGQTPLMMHNGQLADPLHAATKALAELTAKRKKSDEDHGEIARREWHGGLYLDDERRVAIPDQNIQAALIAGAKKVRRGPDAKAGLIPVGELWRLIYKGPNDPDKLWDSGNFSNRSKVNVSGRAVIRTRPFFREWALEFDIGYMPDLLNPTDVRDFLVRAGRECGIGDWRPQYGRFAVVD